MDGRPRDRGAPRLTRANGGWLAPLEARALAWLVPRVPRWLSPDGLTLLGFAAAVVAMAGYVLAARHPVALWLVNLALVVNWLGDSLDGSVARARRIERPRYGFFLDQSVDVLAQFLFSVGLALSGLIQPVIVAFGFGTYLMMTAMSLLRAQVNGVFHLATGGIGLTEVRGLFLAGNVLFYFAPPQPFEGLGLSYADLFGLLWIAVNLLFYVASMRTELAESARLDPPRKRPD